MKVFLNSQGQLTASLKASDTVQDYLDAVEDFTNDHPLGCATCRSRCCQDYFSIGLDNVFAAKVIADVNSQDFWRFVRRNLDEGVLTPKPNQWGECKFLDHRTGRCSLHPNKPLICRLFFCVRSRTPMYLSLFTATVSVFQAALFEETTGHPPAFLSGILDLSSNPALHAHEYGDVRIRDIMRSQRLIAV